MIKLPQLPQHTYALSVSFTMIDIAQVLSRIFPTLSIAAMVCYFVFGPSVRVHYAETLCREAYFDRLDHSKEPYECVISYISKDGLTTSVIVPVSEAKEHAPEAILIRALRSDLLRDTQEKEKWQDREL